jgi:lysozyme family protein
MRENFDKSLALILKLEGGYSNLAADPGGATNLGITLAVLADWRGAPVTPVDVRDLHMDEAARIYRAKYWDLMHCDALPSGIDLAAFDCAVNQGVSRAARFLQMAAEVTADGIIGPKTMAAVSRADTGMLLVEFMARRMNAYGSLQTLFRTFGLGWSRRLMTVYAVALSIVGNVIAL